MMELAFIAEALQLVHGPANPKLFHANTTAALHALGAAGHLPAADARRWWRRTSCGAAFKASTASPA